MMPPPNQEGVHTSRRWSGGLVGREASHGDIQFGSRGHRGHRRFDGLGRTLSRCLGGNKGILARVSAAVAVGEGGLETLDRIAHSQPRCPKSSDCARALTSSLRRVLFSSEDRAWDHVIRRSSRLTMLLVVSCDPARCRRWDVQWNGGFTAGSGAVARQLTISCAHTYINTSQQGVPRDLPSWRPSGSLRPALGVSRRSLCSRNPLGPMGLPLWGEEHGP